MILEFSLKGFCSFKEKETLYLVPGKGARLKGTHYESNFILTSSYRPMKSAIIFGANASGKTNIILGLERLVAILKNGLNIANDFDYKLLNHQSSAIEFEILLLDGEMKNTFKYRVKYNEKELLEEELFFNDTEVFNFKDKSFKVKLIERQSQLEEVFSNRSTETHIKKLNDSNIYEIEEFKKLVGKIAISRESVFNLEAKEMVSQIAEEGKAFFEKNRERVISLLAMLDKSIEELDFKKNQMSDTHYILSLKRYGYDTLFPLSQESDGIKKIVNLMHALLKITEGWTIAIDELDSSISTYSLIKLFNMFVNVDENKIGQLIVTSHNALLFNNNIFSPQQIFIVDKNEELISEIHSLSEYNLRSEKENIFLDFLKGRFGGING